MSKQRGNKDVASQLSSAKTKSSSLDAPRQTDESAPKVQVATVQPIGANDPEPISDAQAWAKSRKGAHAGRGFHYQDAVGAWLAVSMLTREVEVDRLVPEGFEDLCGEGGDPVEWQVKSRQDRVGEFPARDVARFVLKLSADQRRRGSSARAVLVLERGILDVDLLTDPAPLVDLPDGHSSRLALVKYTEANHLSPADLAYAATRRI